MSERTKQQPTKSAQLNPGSPFFPQLGELAADLAKGGHVGVVVAVPGQQSTSYQLRPVNGGEDWRVRADARSLRAVPVPVTHVTPMLRDATYDHRAEQAALPVMVHHEDGGTSEGILVLTPAQVEVYFNQFTSLIARRAKHRQTEL